MEVTEGPEGNFPNFQTELIRNQLADRLKGYEEDGTHKFVLPQGTPEFTEMSHFIAQMLKSLPFNNEVGSTKLMRPDTRHVIDELIAYFEGNKTWEEIAGVFDPHQLEVFKNEVYSSHNIPSAICYNIDLQVFPAGGDVPKGIAIQRINMINIDGQLKGVYDGSFDVRPEKIIVDPVDYNLYHLHPGP